MQTRLFLILLFCILSIQSAVAQELSTAESCSNFKVGTFVYVNPELPHVVVKRNDNKQTETIGKGRNKKQYTFNIVWTSPCNYTLNLIEVSDFRDKKMLGTRLNIQILEVNGDSYRFVSYDGKGERNEGWVKRIK